MRLPSLLAAAALLAFGGVAAAQEVSSDPAAAPAGVYRLDKRNASVTVKVSHMGLSFYTMRFDAVDGSYVFDPANPAAAKISVAIQAASIDTGDPAFSAQIASQVFEAQKYPTITFVSTAVHPGQGGRGEVVGDLTLHGVTRPVTLDVVFNGVGQSGQHEPRMGFSAVATVPRSAFGVNAYPGVVGDEVSVVIEAEFQR